MSKRIGLWVGVLALVAAPTLALAASPWAAEQGWGNQAKGKLVYGVKNTLLGWTELFTEPKEAMDSGGNFFVGLGKGVKNAVFDELGGAVHIATFPITSLDAPLPEGGTQVL